MVEQVRQARIDPPAGSALAVIAWHRQEDGSLLEPRVAAVELLNVLRPTVAVCWFITYAAHALQLWPGIRAALRSGDPVFATAFTHEVRRYYPFAPFIGGRAAKDQEFHGESIPDSSTVLVDLYGHNHDPQLWPDPYDFTPERFLNRPIGEYDLVPQGGGNPHTGHRCPGEGITVGLLEALSIRLASLDYDVPVQDLSIRANRIPARVRSGFKVTRVRPATAFS
jgi:fatty-acid peroxygenase